MEQYIPKSAVLTEIKRRIERCAKQREDMLNVQCHTLADDASARMGELNCFQDFLDTIEVLEVGIDFGDPKGDKCAKCIIDTKDLEVKEVDFEQEFERFLNEVEGVPRMWHSDEQIEWAKDLAKHFFELGLKAKEENEKKYIGYVGGTSTTTTK